MAKLKIIFIFIFCIIQIQISFSQELDTLQIIKDIRAKFGLIYNHKIDGMQEWTLSPQTDNQENTEVVYGSESNTTIYYKDSNVYMIRTYGMSDEGGPLSYYSKLTETYFYDNQPFFFYQKSFVGDYHQKNTGDPIYKLEEIRKYIYEGKIIRQLIKTTRRKGMWITDKTQLINAKTDSVPNTKAKIRKYRDNFYWNPDDIKKYLIRIKEEYDKI